MYFVNKVYLAVTFAKLILGVYEYQAMLGSNFLSACEELARIVLHYGIILCADNALGDDFLF